MSLASFARTALPVAIGVVSMCLAPMQAQTRGVDPAEVNAGGETPTLTTATYGQWRDYLQPGEDEARWLEIPWRGSFWEGVQDAQIEGKPVLLWAMNGHPMGCT